MTLWMTVWGVILLFFLGMTFGKAYQLINILWLTYFLVLTGLLGYWARHINRKINNLLLDSPDPDLSKKGFPVKAALFASMDRNIEKLYSKLETAKADMVNQKARQAGENFNLMLSSTTDRLTGVPNRAALDKQMNKVTGRINELSVIMMDIDHFKTVNDTYGHDAGDLVLKQFAVIVKRSVRPVDFLGRYGGEEFTVICDAALETAVEIAGRARQAVAATPVKISETRKVSITASFGVAEYLPGDTPAAVIKRADNALYQAKQSGRNRVCRGGEPQYRG